MDANLSYPHIIEDYKKHLREFTENHLSFESFCLPYHVRVKSVRQWMYRHGLDVSTLYYEVLLEKCNSDPDFVLPSGMGSRRNHCSPTENQPSSGHSSSCESIKGVRVTFPDGVVINIRQTTASALNKFIRSYNKLNDISHVQSE